LTFLAIEGTMGTVQFTTLASLTIGSLGQFGSSSSSMNMSPMSPTALTNNPSINSVMCALVPISLYITLVFAVLDVFGTRTRAKVRYSDIAEYMNKYPPPPGYPKDDPPLNYHYETSGILKALHKWKPILKLGFAISLGVMVGAEHSCNGGSVMKTIETLIVIVFLHIVINAFGATWLI